MREVKTRALKTFIQAVLGYLCTLGITGIDMGDKKVVLGVVIAAISAGLSALMNIDWTMKSEQEEVEDEVSEITVNE